METKLLKTLDLKSRGWTDSLIRKFLSKPDETRANPKYPNAGSPMKLYRSERVEEVEASEEFREAKQKVDARKLAAKKAVETKLAKMEDYLGSLEIEVQVMDRDDLIKAAQENLRSLDLPSSVQLTDERMCVNFLRHCETKYEHELEKISGKTGAVDAYYDIKEMVLYEIERTYGWLADECNRQREELTKKRYQDF